MLGKQSHVKLEATGKSRCGTLHSTSLSQNLIQLRFILKNLCSKRMAHGFISSSTCTVLGDLKGSLKVSLQTSRNAMWITVRFVARFTHHSLATKLSCFLKPERSLRSVFSKLSQLELSSLANFATKLLCCLQSGKKVTKSLNTTVSRLKFAKRKIPKTRLQRIILKLNSLAANSYTVKKTY